MHPNTRHKNLLENKKVLRWYQNLEVRSSTTANVYLRNFGLWLEYLERDPDSIIEFANDDFEEFKASISDQIRDMESRGMAGSSISTSVKPLVSYLKFHNVVVKLNLNIKNENRNFNAEQERIPEKYQLRSVLLKSGKREQVAISLMAFSGVRPEVLGNDDGSDGLRLKDIPDLSINGEIDIKEPAKIEVRAEISKTGLHYFTFLGSEGCAYLKDYLNDRKRNGETLSSDSPLIMPEQDMSRKESPNEFLTTVLVSRRIKRSIRKAEFNWRPYIFRIYFGTNLDSAEAKGFISHPWRQFIMGHKGDIEETYTKRKGKVDEGRNQYAKSLQFLETESKVSEESIENLEKSFTARSLKWFGFSDAEIKDMINLSDDELQKRIEERRGMQINNGHKQKVISMAEVEKFIVQGWEYVNSLPGDKAIVKIPDH